MRRLALGLGVLLLLLVVPATVHAQAEYECSTYCQPYMSCDEGCVYCTGPDNPDYYCSNYYWTTCGGSGLTCGQCAIVNTWEEDVEISRYPVFPPLCGGSETWYHYVNWSVFVRYIKNMRHVTYGTQICNGVTSTVVVSQYNFTDECFDFIYPDCDGTVYYEGYEQFWHAMECHW